MWLLRLMADRGLALLDAGTLLMVIEERGELRVAAASGEGTPRVRIMPVEGSALGALYRAGEPVALDRPRGQEAAWLHELGIEARAVLVEPLSMEGQGGGMVIALRSDGGFRNPDRQALNAFATSVSQRLVAERSVEIERLRYGMEARERERTRWAREIHDETIQGLGALRLKLANARDVDERAALSAAVEAVLEGLGDEIDGLRHLITELRPAALDDLGLAAALEALARRMQAIDGLDVRTEIDLGPESAQRRLDPELESTIYRVVQEALTNVSRHAQATHALVSVSERDGMVRASVTDDGKGLPNSERLGPRGDGLEGGFGMSGMRERAELVGGELELVPAPGRGTVMRLSVPLDGTTRGGARARCTALRAPRPRASSAGSLPCGGRLLLVHQPQLPRVGGDLRARGETELLYRARAIGLDRALGHVQLLGDLGVGVPVGDQPDHLALALGQRDAVGGIVLAGGHQRAEPRVQIVAPRNRQAEGLEQLRRLGLLQHVAARPRPQRLAGVLGVLAHRQDRDRERRMSDEALWQRREARAARHRQVEREQVRLVLAHRADRGRDVGGFVEDPKLSRLPLEHGADAVAHDPVVIGDDHVDRSIHPWRAVLHLAHTVAPGRDNPWIRATGSRPRTLWDYTDLPFWDDTIGTTGPTDKRL